MPHPGHCTPGCTLGVVKRILLTGMSGTGKTTLVEELRARGYKAVYTDDGWTEPSPDGRQRWREDAIELLLATEDADVLFVAECEENQGKFLDRFDQIILLSAPVETLVQRLATRTTNLYGKSSEELERVLDDVENVEPLLRGIATHEVRKTMPLEDVVASVLRLVNE